jgi:hypothetical protein
MRAAGAPRRDRVARTRWPPAAIILPAAALAAAALVTSLCGRVGAQMPPVSDDTAALTDRWVAAVRQHDPGTIDDAARFVLGLAPGDRQVLLNGVNLFLCAADGRDPGAKTDAERRIAALGTDVADAHAFNRFLERAAMLHGDAAMMSLDHPELTAAAAPAAGPAATRG